MDQKQEPKTLTHVDCKARFRILHKENGQVWVCREFLIDRSQTTANKGHLQFLRSNRKVPAKVFKLARSMKSVGIKTCHIMSYMAQQAGSYDKVKYLINDLYNKLSPQEDVALADEDAVRVIGYLEHKVEYDLGFFGKFSYNKER